MKKFYPILTTILLFLLLCAKMNVVHANIVFPEGEPVFVKEQTITDNNPEVADMLYGAYPHIVISEEGASGTTPGERITAACFNHAFDKLYEENELFYSVKTLVIDINSPDYPDLDLSQMVSFLNLEYITLHFTYDACGNNSDETCLLPLVQSLVKPGNHPITVMYRLYIGG